MFKKTKQKVGHPMNHNKNFHLVSVFYCYPCSREVRKLVFRAEGQEFNPLEAKEFLTVFV